MASEFLTNKGTDRMLEGNIADSSIVKAVLKKLDHRAKLKELAKEVFQGIQSTLSAEPLNEEMLVGELDPATLCGSDGDPKTKDSVRFVCSDKDFKCGPGKYICEWLYDWDYCTPPFECTNDHDCGEFIFDCFSFSCTTKNHDCDAPLEFSCGYIYECTDSKFDCTGGHAFFCFNDHTCEDNFTCNAGGIECTKTYPYSIDDDAGDFLCGSTGEGSDTFNCYDKFTCSADDDFECFATTSFDCGPGGSETETFDCDCEFNCGNTVHEDFGCWDYFDCEGHFDCVETEGGYDCPVEFTCDYDYGCNNSKLRFDCDDVFNCNDDFHCPADFDCLSQYDCATTFDCDDTFNCGETEYDCPGESTHDCSGSYNP